MLTSARQFSAGALAFLTCVLVVAAPAQAPRSSRIEWDTNRSVVRVKLEPPQLEQAKKRALAEVLTVSVQPRDVLSAIGLPAIVGTHALTNGTIEFRPRYPFEPGISYRAALQLPGGAAETSVLRLPKPSLERTTEVREIYPTAKILPQNLLKFYLHFSAPMSGGHIYDHIQLTDGEGRAVELPFLEIDEELWNPEMTRLTLFLDPGRIKREVKPLEEVGPALVPGKSYVLRISSKWLDARGAELKEDFRKEFSVSEPDRSAPEPKEWKISAPRAESREVLEVRFADPMDHALALRMINVKDARGAAVNGTKTLAEQEEVWRFAPEAPWKAGRYQLLVQSTIEDLAGNNIGKPFEVDLAEGEGRRDPPRMIRLAFEVK